MTTVSASSNNRRASESDIASNKQQLQEQQESSSSTPPKQRRNTLPFEFGQSQNHNNTINEIVDDKTTLDNITDWGDCIWSQHQQQQQQPSSGDSTESITDWGVCTWDDVWVNTDYPTTKQTMTIDYLFQLRRQQDGSDDDDDQLFDFNLGQRNSPHGGFNSSATAGSIFVADDEL